MKKSIILSLLFLFNCSYFSLELKAEEKYVIIVNSQNNASADLGELKLLFMKKKGNWSNGFAVKPYFRKKNSKAQNAMIQKVLGISNVQLEQHWLSLKQKTGKTAPRVIKSDKLLIKFIAKNKGSLGVISKKFAAKLGDKVKILKEF